MFSQKLPVSWLRAVMVLLKSNNAMKLFKFEGFTYKIFNLYTCIVCYIWSHFEDNFVRQFCSIKNPVCDAINDTLRMSFIEMSYLILIFISKLKYLRNTGKIKILTKRCKMRLDIPFLTVYVGIKSLDRLGWNNVDETYSSGNLIVF